jgi:hypothetical protein
MRNSAALGLVLLAGLALACEAGAESLNSHNPTWWSKYRALATNGASSGGGSSNSVSVGSNTDMSNECGPQSETFIAVNTANPKVVAGGSNEIFRDPMRGYFSTDSGASWGGVDLPLPPPIAANGTRFGSDPGLAFDTKGNLFYSYIVVFFGNGNGVSGSEMAVARSSDGGATYPFANYFSFGTGSDHFNDKPMIASDTNAASPFKDNVYVGWDAATGGSSGGGVRFARSADHGATFTVTRIDNPNGPGQAIGVDPFVGPLGEVYLAWNDYAANTIAFSRSLDGGVTWTTPSVIAAKSVAFDIAIPAQSFRHALIYPACDADRSSGANRGKLYCSWVDLTASGRTDVFTSFSNDRGASWSPPQSATDAIRPNPDHFNQWLSVDPSNGQASLSFYDTRNDTTGQRTMTDVYFTQSPSGTLWLTPNVRVTSASSNEHDCNGLYPCSAIDYGNQYGDYEGLASFGGVSRPIWTDSRNQLNTSAGCRTNRAMEEVFTAKLK